MNKLINLLIILGDDKMYDKVTKILSSPCAKCCYGTILFTIVTIMALGFIDLNVDLIRDGILPSDSDDEAMHFAYAVLYMFLELLAICISLLMCYLIYLLCDSTSGKPTKGSYVQV